MTPMFRRTSILVSLTLAISSLSSRPTLAQGAAGLEEVVVTATRRATGLQTTPVAITAFTEAALDRAMVFDARDLASRTPNLQIGGDAQLGSFPIVIRGIGTSVPDGPGSDGSVAVYVDDVYLGRPYANVFELVDIERVEVLRGPQGTLYGRNATGGALNFISKQPGPEFEAAADLLYDEHGTVRVRGYAMGPVSDAVGMKIAGGYRDKGAWTKNSFDGSDAPQEESWSLRGSMVVSVNEDLDVTLSADAGELDRVPLFKNTSLFGPDFHPDTYSYDQPAEDRREWWGVQGTVDYAFDGASLTVIGAYRDQSADQAFDSDATFLDLVNIASGSQLSSDQYSFEARLTSDESGPFNWIIGVYHFQEEGSFAPAQVFAGSAATGLPFPILVADFSTFNKTESYALFGEASYDLTNRLSATLGLRYSDETKEFSREDLIDPAGSGNAKASWDEVTPKLIFNYQATDDVFVYASVTQGFKSGGWTFGSFNADPADPEKVWSYESGIKSQVFDDKLRLNLAGFYYDYTDLQKRILIVPGVTGVVNAAEAEVLGAEIEFEAVLTDNLSLFGSLGYLKATYDSYSEPVFDGTGSLVGSNDFSGQRLDRAPRMQVNLAGEYTVALGSAGALVFYGEYSRESTSYYSPFNDAEFVGHDGFDIFNARITWQSPSEKFSVSAYLNNLADDRYVTSVLDFQGLGLGTPATFNDPRTLGVMAAYRF